MELQGRSGFVFGVIDILYNKVGISLPGGRITQSEAEWVAALTAK